MTEMKPVIYPTLSEVREQPTAPNVINGGSNDRGHSYRLKIIREIQEFLEGEIKNREAFSKKYFRIAKIVNIIDNGLIVFFYRSRRNRCRFVGYWCRCSYCFKFRD